ncbi:HD domain-containing phosphohydrolase [Desulfonatronovibrio magnus]|uniref:HD domain-containing phosphohydrolase n=1 Tax=Desulfonatronovibrio magnus TaxID=698827 RepID=UPI0005EBD601|nr:HD domain-containing phosphohydrolase [Desulfonatronovibrio magnus]RQD66632.1 MAG: response regulator [Desulfonatronovibrio sp. MSAO_Bac4]
MNDYKILFVDDDLNILQGFKRTLRKKFCVDTASGPVEGMKAINEKGPYAVVVADLKMPEMNGVEFLSRVRNLFPDSVRIMLTGQADLISAVEAINAGNVFRFLTKPCYPVNLERALNDGIKQYRLIRAEKEILEDTVRGITQVLTDILGSTNELAMGRATRIKHLVRDTAARLGETDVWFYETGALLSQVGCITLPPSVLEKLKTGERLQSQEIVLFARHPESGSRMISMIPRLENLASMIAYQEKLYDGRGVPLDEVEGKDIPLGSRILKLILDYDLLMSRGYDVRGAMEKILIRKGRYDPDVIRAFVEVLQTQEQYEHKQIRLAELTPYMVITEEIRSLSGRLLLQKGSELSPSQIEKLVSLDKSLGVKHPISVLIPPQALRKG